MNEPTDIDKLIKGVLTAAAYRAEMQAKLVPTHAHAETSFLADSAGPLAVEVKRLRSELEDESKRAEIHARLNERVAGVLGLLDVQIDPKTGEEYLPSWHDMPEQVVALRAELDVRTVERDGAQTRLDMVFKEKSAIIEELRLTLAAEQGKRRAADAVLAQLATWCLTYGASLCPRGGDADTFGDGVRAMKEQVSNILRTNKAGSPS